MKTTLMTISVNTLVKYPDPLTLREVKFAIEKYQQPQKVMHDIQTGCWMDPEIKDFSKFKDEFSIYNVLILRQKSHQYTFHLYIRRP